MLGSVFRMGFTELFIVFIMAIIVVMYVRQYYGEVELVKARTDGRTYIVRKLPDSQEAAERLARVNQKLGRLVKHMQDKFPDDEDVARLVGNYNPASLSEGGTEVGYTSYSVNKGEKIVLCLRHAASNSDGKRDLEFVDENVIAYVAIHELGHLMTKEVGHPPQFWENFKRLAEQARDIGVYDSVDFEKKPQPYCGIRITSSVLKA